MEIPSSPDLPLPPPQVASVLWNYDANVYTNRNIGAPQEASDQ